MISRAAMAHGARGSRSVSVLASTSDACRHVGCYYNSIMMISSSSSSAIAVVVFLLSHNKAAQS